MSKKLLPDVLKGDKRATALAELIEKDRQEIQELLPFLFVYNLSTLSDSELEDLAWQFDVSKTAWKLTQDRSQKEELVKNAIILKMKLGTPWAIKKVLEILKLGGEIHEWFTYNGKPYHFKIDLFFEELIKNGITLTPEIEEKLLRLINAYKNERSWLEELKFNVFFENEQEIGASSNLSTFTKATFEEDSEKKILMSQDGEYKILGTGIKPVTFTTATFEENSEKVITAGDGVSIFAGNVTADGFLKASFESTETEWDFSSTCAVTGSFNSVAFIRINLTGGIN
ncbi:phage tail protein I [Desulfurobacterium crinifex]